MFLILKSTSSMNSSETMESCCSPTCKPVRDRVVFHLFVERLWPITGSQQNQDRIAWIGSDCRSDRTPDWVGLVFWLLVQKNYFEKSCFWWWHKWLRIRNANFSQQKSRLWLGNQCDSHFFFQAACVTNKKNRFSIRLKTIAQNYFQLNCTGKFSVA